MPLTPREERALRAIEEALAAEDPALGDLLRRPPTRWRAGVLGGLRWAVLAVAVVLVLVGLVLSLAGLFFGALLTLLLLVAIWRRASPSSSGGRRV